MSAKGDRFGMLTLERKVSVSGQKQRWLCKCDCGNTKEMRLDDMRQRVKAGLPPSCGCAFHEMRSEISLRAFDPTRYMLKRFGQLLVTGVAVDAGRVKGKQRLVCMCDCGAQVVVRPDQLTRGVTRSCGHLQREFASELGSLELRHGQTVFGELAGGVAPVYQSWATIKKCVSMGWRRGAHRVCHEYDPRWDVFEEFWKDIGNIRPHESVSRRDNKLPWSKENCYVHPTYRRAAVASARKTEPRVEAQPER
jgi:hypothetical protein